MCSLSRCEAAASDIDSDLCECVACPDVKQPPVTAKHEQVDKQKRKQILETLSGILQEKKKCIDANELEARDEFLAADDTVSASSSLRLPEIQKASSGSLSTADSSASHGRNPKSREYKVKNVAEERDVHRGVNLSSRRESVVESGRNSSTPANFKQNKQFSDHEVKNSKHSKPDNKPPQLGRCPSSSKRLQPLLSRSSRRKFSGNDRSRLGPYRSRANVNEHEPVVAPASVQHTGKVADLSHCEIERNSDEPVNDISSESNNQQFCVQEVEHKSLDQPSSVPTTERDTDDNEEESFVFSPPRKVRLKYTTGQRTTAPAVTDVTPVNNCRNSTSPSPSSRQHKQQPDDEVEDYQHSKLVKKPPFLGHSTSASKHCVQESEAEVHCWAVTDVVLSPVNNCRNSTSPSPSSRQHKQQPDNKVEDQEQSKPVKKPPLFGRFPSASKHCVQPLMSCGVKRKFSGNDTSLLRPHRSSASEYEGGISKCSKMPLLDFGACSGEYTKTNRNDYPDYRRRFSGQGTHRYSPVQDRSEWLNNDMFQVQRATRFERENGFTNDPLWQKRQEQTSCHERDGALSDEEERWLQRDYESRRDRPLRPERLSDLRQKLDAHRCYRDMQHGDGYYSFQREARRPLLSDDHIDSGRRCLLSAPPRQQSYKVSEDESHMVDDLCHDEQRHRYNSHLGDFSGPRRDDLLLQEDDDSWTDVDRRRWKQSWDFSDQEDPRRDWNREVRQYSCLLLHSLIYCSGVQEILRCNP